MEAIDRNPMIAVLVSVPIVMLSAGYGDEIPGPTNSEQEGEAPPTSKIKTPRKMEVVDVTIKRWPEKKSPGDNAHSSAGCKVIWDERTYRRANYGEPFFFYLYDKDGTSADDTVTFFSLYPHYHYKRDNATTFIATLANRDSEIVVRGNWIY